MHMCYLVPVMNLCVSVYAWHVTPGVGILKNQQTGVGFTMCVCVVSVVLVEQFMT